MSYKNFRASKCALIEYTKSSSQTISTNSSITWDIKKSTGGDDVSINSTTGVITLNPDRRYLLQASICIDKSSYNQDFELNFVESDGTTISASQGALACYHSWEAIRNSNPFINSSFVSTLVVNNPTKQYKLSCISVPVSSSFETNSNLFITELY